MIGRLSWIRLRKVMILNIGDMSLFIVLLIVG